MNKMVPTLLWEQFGQEYGLTAQQCEQFRTYYELLCAANELFNLTTITDLSSVLAYHFADSLELGNYLDMTKVAMIADVGTGAGFPGLVLKIKYPHLCLILIEVNHKKIQFLESVVHDLKLTDVMIESRDWRTFLRKTNYSIDFFCARASLHPDELLRMFQPSCLYHGAQLVYWAGKSWEPTKKEQPFVQKTFSYAINKKPRTYVIYGRSHTMGKVDE